MTDASPQGFPALPRPAEPAHVIRSDEEAIDVASALAEEFARGAAERDRDRRLPVAEVQRLSESGLLGINIPRAHGGAGVSYATVAEVFAIVSAADPSLGQIPQSHVSLIDLIRFDPDEGKQRFFYGEALRGIRFGNAISEKGGKTILDMKTRLIVSEEGLRVRGRKAYATGALFAHLVPVQAIDDRGKGFLAFLERDAPGLTVIDDWSGFGQRTTASGTVLLDDVFVPASHVLATHRAFDAPSVHGPVAQIIQAAIDLGIARAAVEDTIRFVRSASRPWIDSGKEHAHEDPFTLREVGTLAIHLHAAEAVLARSGRVIDEALLDENEETVAQASIAVAEAKILTTEIAIRATNTLFELAGTSATLAEHNLDRHWRNARTHTLHDPVRWKFHAIGNHRLNGVKPPRHSWI